MIFFPKYVRGERAVIRKALLRIAAVTSLLTVLILFQCTYRTNHISSLSLSSGTSTSGDDGDDDWPPPRDKVVVVPKMSYEDTDWLGPDLPDWQHAVYHMDDLNGTFQVPKNKGKEAMAYLTYLIDHYSRLPSTIAFIHSHREGYPRAWHTDADDYNIVNVLQNLQIQYVQEEGYVNLRCIHDPGCPAEIQPFREPYDEERITEHEFPDAWKYMFGKESPVPPRVGVACCSQFAVSRTQVLRRSRDEYKQYREWILQTKLGDEVSGRVMEYLWHIIFGKEAVFCPDLHECYCRVLGRCRH